MKIRCDNKILQMIFGYIVCINIGKSIQIIQVANYNDLNNYRPLANVCLPGKSPFIRLLNTICAAFFK